MKTSSLCALFAACLSLPAFGFEPDVIIDANDNPANVELYPAASWTNETNVTNAFRGASKVRNYSGPTDYVRFHTLLPSQGPWQVFVWNNLGSRGPTTATVTHADGTANISYTDYNNLGQWLLLGTFWFNTTTEAEVKYGGTASKLSADAVRFSLATPDIVLDSTNSAGVTLSPANDWVSVSSTSGYLQNTRRSNTSEATITFQPTLPAAGDYEISLWLPPNSGTWLPGGGTAATTFTVDVHGRNGVVTNHTINMPGTAANEGRWVQVSSTPFRFNATPPPPNPYPAKVVIKTNGATGEWVPADAVRFTKVGKAGIAEVYMDEDDGLTVTASPGLWGSGTALSTQFNYGVMPFGPAYKAEYFGSSSQSPRSMTYSPENVQLGLYDVYLWYGYYNNQSYYNNPSTEVKIRSATGVVTRTLNQRGGGGKWNHVGRYIFDPSDDANPPWLKISTPTNPYVSGTSNHTQWFYYNEGRVLADGVLFLRDGEDADGDVDGLPDWLEVLILTSNSTADANGDGIPDGRDTDGNGINDGDEDFDGDGVPNGDDYLLGLNPLDPDTDGDGIPDGAEVARGTDPTSADSDNDGVNDNVDLFPKDNRRSKLLPMITLSTIDLSALHPQPGYTPFSVAINDNDQVGFAGTSATQYFASRSLYGANYATKYLGMNVEVGTTTYIYDATGVTPSGLLFGSAEKSNDPKKYIFELGINGGSPTLLSASGHDTALFLQPATRSDNGTIHGYINDIFDFQETTAYMEKTFTGALSGIQANKHRIAVQSASLDGKMIGKEEPEGMPPTYWFWDGGLFALPQTVWDPVAVNDSGDIIGGYGPSTYLYIDETVTPLTDLIPQEFGNQIRILRPLTLSNRDEVSDFPIIEFEGENLEEPEEPGDDAEWNVRTFRMSKFSDGTMEVATVSVEVTPPASPQEPNPQPQLLNLNANETNKNGTSVEKDASGIVRVSTEMDFLCDNEKAHLGFDPPLTGDAHPVPVHTPDKDPRFASGRKYYASVVNSGTGMTNSSIRVWFRSLEYAQTSQLVVPTAFQTMVDVSPKNQAFNPIPFDEAKGESCGYFQAITITAMPPPLGTTDLRIATIEVRGTVKVGNEFPLRGVLTVLVFPEVKVDVAFHWVSDTHEKSIIPSDYPAKYQKRILDAMNDCMQQAGVTFVQNDAKCTAGTFHYDLDNNGMLNSRARNDPERVAIENHAPFRGPTADFLNGTGAKLNIIVLNGPLANQEKALERLPGQIGLTGGFAPVDADQNGDSTGSLYGQVFMLVKNWGHLENPARFAGFAESFAHECGHAFALSTRNNYLPLQRKYGPKDSHDEGVFLREGMRLTGGVPPGKGLMYYEGGISKWMRNEDWRRANDVARRFGTTQ